MTFQKAERRQHKPKIALTGPSGSGKTFSALLIASGMGKRIAVIDTENGSASLYANMDKGPLKGITFDVLEIDPPYTIAKYVQAIEDAQAAKYDVLVVDSISHAWAGEGGLLAKKEALDNRGGNQNSYTNWASITKEHELFKARILNADIIMICTLRSKQDYVLETNDKGKQAPKKVGMAPIQRDGMEYEFTTVFDLAMDHNAAASKDRTAMFDGQIIKPTRKTGEQINEWLAGGKPIERKPAAAPAPAPVQAEQAFPENPGEASDRATMVQLEQIVAGVKVMAGLGWSAEQVYANARKQVTKIHNREFAETNELTQAEAATVIDFLVRWAEHVRKGKAQAAAKHSAAENSTAGA